MYEYRDNSTDTGISVKLMIECFLKFSCITGGTGLKGAEHPYSLASTQDFVMDNVECSGSENRLVDCNYLPRHDCQLDEVAAVHCYGM